jgi:polar amino acid transport system substrate-binding protein
MRTPERERFAHFSQPGVQSPNVLFLHADGGRKWRISSLADLRGTDFRLGAQIGVSYGPDYERLMRDPTFSQLVQKVSTRRNLWLMMAAGRLDGVLANEATGRAELTQLDLQNKIRSSGMVLPHTTASVAFSRKVVSETFVEHYNRVNEVMLKDGSHAAILRRYGSP